MVERIEKAILLIRGEKIILDRTLADLYGVQTKQLKRAVRRNINRFPPDFMFELTKEEYQSLRYQFGTLKRGEHSKYLPLAFTEQGVAMLSSVLKSERAIEVNIAIMRVFVRLREMMATHKELALKLRELEGRIQDHDEQIVAIFWCHVPQVRCIKCHFDPRESGGRNLEFQKGSKISPCCRDDDLSLRRDTRPSAGS